jgi:hypothetical protein
MPSVLAHDPPVVNRVRKIGTKSPHFRHTSASTVFGALRRDFSKRWLALSAKDQLAHLEESSSDQAELFKSSDLFKSTNSFKSREFLQIKERVVDRGEAFSNRSDQ